MEGGNAAAEGSVRVATNTGRPGYPPLLDRVVVVVAGGGELLFVAGRSKDCGELAFEGLLPLSVCEQY